MTDPDAYLAELIERHALIDQLSNHDGFRMLEDYMRAERVAKQRRILSGNLGSVEEYKHLTGWVQGVDAVFSAAERLLLQIQAERARIAAAKDDE